LLLLYLFISNKPILRHVHDWNIGRRCSHHLTRWCSL